MRVFDSVIDQFKHLVVRRRLYRFYEFLFQVSLRGLGILNSEDTDLSGEKYFVNHALKKFNEPIVLDVGANVGRYSNTIKLLYPQAKIYAFEPHPKIYATLYAEAQKYGYTALNLGCDQAEGSLKLYDYEDMGDGEHASIYRDVIEKIHHGTSIAYNIEVTTVDQFVTTQGLSTVNLLKIDTEGNELSILRGAQKIITTGRVDVIHFEFGAMNIVSRAYLSDFYTLLPMYDFYRMLPDGLVALGKHSPFYEIFAYQNIVAIHKNSKASYLEPR
jgi:FkbM family methyltransferase